MDDYTDCSSFGDVLWHRELVRLYLRYICQVSVDAKQIGKMRDLQFTDPERAWRKVAFNCKFARGVDFLFWRRLRLWAGAGGAAPDSDAPKAAVDEKAVAMANQAAVVYDSDGIAAVASGSGIVSAGSATGPAPAGTRRHPPPEPRARSSCNGNAPQRGGETEHEQAAGVSAVQFLLQPSKKKKPQKKALFIDDPCPKPDEDAECFSNTCCEGKCAKPSRCDNPCKHDCAEAQRDKDKADAIERHKQAVAQKEEEERAAAASTGEAQAAK
eukprot:g3495.t1